MPERTKLPSIPQTCPDCVKTSKAWRTPFGLDLQSVMPSAHWTRLGKSELQVAAVTEDHDLPGLASRGSPRSRACFAISDRQRLPSPTTRREYSICSVRAGGELSQSTPGIVKFVTEALTEFELKAMMSGRGVRTCYDVNGSYSSPATNAESRKEEPLVHPSSEGEIVDFPKHAFATQTCLVKGVFLWSRGWRNQNSHSERNCKMQF